MRGDVKTEIKASREVNKVRHVLFGRTFPLSAAAAESVK